MTMTTLVRWDPLREVAAVHTELGRLMNGLFDGPSRTPQAWVPTLDVWESEDALHYAFDLPGIPRDAIAIEVEEGALTVSATREREHEADADRYHRFERRYGTFSRTIGLPQGVTEESIKAVYANGVLELHVAKPEQPKPRKIQIGVGGSEPQKTIEGSAERK
jgi:HSP20 family protein